jgi:hypothetical protein
VPAPTVSIKDGWGEIDQDFPDDFTFVKLWESARALLSPKAESIQLDGETGYVVDVCDEGGARGEPPSPN